MDSGQLVFSDPSEMECSFWIKATKAVLKSFRENEAQAFTGLKEYKPVTVFSFESIKFVPEANGLALLFTKLET